MVNLNDLCEEIKNKGYKLTNHRLKILEVFIENQNYLLDAAEVFERVLKDNKNINFSTVYRNLEILNKIGVIKKINLEDGIKSYKLVSNHIHHHHLICKACGKTLVIEYCPYESINDNIFSDNDFYPENHKFEIYGYCKNCFKNKDSEGE